MAYFSEFCSVQHLIPGTPNRSVSSIIYLCSLSPGTSHSHTALLSRGRLGGEAHRTLCVPERFSGACSLPCQRPFPASVGAYLFLFAPGKTLIISKKGDLLGFFQLPLQPIPPCPPAKGTAGPGAGAARGQRVRLCPSRSGLGGLELHGCFTKFLHGVGTKGVRGETMNS